MNQTLSHRLLWRFVAWLARALMLFLGKLRISHRERIPAKGPLLILANHSSYADPILLQVACRRHVVFVGNSDVQNEGWISKFANWWGFIPIVPNTPDRKALRAAIDHLKTGGALCLFPEGGLSESGEIMPFLPGAGLIFRQSGATVICVGIRGATQILAFQNRRFRRAKWPVEVNWSLARTADEFESADDMLTWAESEVHRLCEPGPQEART